MGTGGGSGGWLYTLILTNYSTCENELVGSLLIETFLLKKHLHRICGSFMRITKIIQYDCRAKMGQLFMGANIWLQFSLSWRNVPSGSSTSVKCGLTVDAT